ncbi:MAG: VWA domain-containing protein, partial [Actinobacteria bacterium]|nr:VWA domain-containing protein [Actinomycetota bacterium]
MRSSAHLTRVAWILVALAVPALPPVALASADVRGVDIDDDQAVHLTIVTSDPVASPPRVRENGRRVSGLRAENLGRAKSVVLAIDRSQSMKGEPLDDAAAAAHAFIAAKPSEDRIAVTAFATQPVLLTGFSTATIDAQGALRTLSVDPVMGTTLYDALVLSAGALSAERYEGRVIIAVTDGNETRSEASLQEAIAAANEAGATVYVVAIESNRFTPEPLKKLAAATGGAYYGAASTEALEEIYTSIAEELQRTWRLEYVTAARPGDSVAIEARFPGGDRATTELTVPGAPYAGTRAEPSPLLPKQLLQGWWGPFALAAAVALLVLVGAFLALASPKGAWLKTRLAPHTAAEKLAVKRRSERERLAVAAGLFRVTEKTFGHLRVWKKLQATIDRADVPLRTVELVYIMSGAGLFVGLVAAVIGPPRLFVLGALVLGALLPYAFVAYKARRRLKTFEAQLPDLLTTMAASLKAGHSFRQGIQAIVDEDQEPASKEFKRVLAETRLGRPMDAALAEMSNRVGSKNLEFVLTAVTIQRQVGGSLAGIFDMVAETVRNRHQFARKIKGLTAMG